MERSVFVAREHELEQLGGYLDLALAGQGQVCFVTGEAGSGKTALISEFACRAQQQHQDLIVALGRSDSLTGSGDPYLPFRETLLLLTGDVEAKLAQGAITSENARRLREFLRVSVEALVEVGPNLIDILVPWAGLAARAAAFLVDKAGWLDRVEILARLRQREEVIGGARIGKDHIFEQYTNVLKTLAEKRPLMLMLDDLHWADADSIDLLFCLGRRTESSRILIVGTYRPEEVALGRAGERHPLDKVLTEFKRYYGDTLVDLDRANEAEGRHFVDALLETEGNRLGEQFRHELHRHTGGQPLFTIELLRAMQERGDLVQDERKQWVTGHALDWQALPPEVEGVIEERTGRLDDELRRALAVASVEGEGFTAEVVARVCRIETQALVWRLDDELARRHRLVTAQGSRLVATQQLSLYRFQHNLFQTYLYNNLSSTMRPHLHRGVGQALEELHGELAGEIAVQLARHFVNGQVSDKACHYLHLAGEQAALRFANDEAVDYFSHALELAPETDIAYRYALLLARETVYDLQGKRVEQEQDLAALKELADALDDGGQQAARRQARVALRLAHYPEVTGDFPAAVEAAQKAIDWSRAAQDLNAEAMGHLIWGRALLRLGEHEMAKSQLGHALALARAGGLHQLEAVSLRSLGLNADSQADYAGARACFDESLGIYRSIQDQRGEGAVLNNLGVLSAKQGRFARARDRFEQALKISRKIGDRKAEADALGNLGTLSAVRGEYTQAKVWLEEILQVRQEIDDRRGQADALTNLGELSADQGDFSGARAYYERALQLYRETEQRGREAQVLAYLGLLSHILGEDELARQYSDQALGIARKIGDLSTQGYAWTHLGHALERLNHLDAAAEAYQHALDLRAELGEHNLAVEVVAGLARVCLVQKNLSQAQAHGEEILSYLENHTLDGTKEPFRVYLTCYNVLQASRDPRAEDILKTAHSMLQERAAGIENEELRHSFLEHVPDHREIVRRFEQAASAPP